jgi:hypothetical protein
MSRHPFPPPASRRARAGGRLPNMDTFNPEARGIIIVRDVDAA